MADNYFNVLNRNNNHHEGTNVVNLIAHLVYFPDLVTTLLCECSIRVFEWTHAWYIAEAYFVYSVY